MSRIGLNESIGFTIIPEGVHTFQITAVDYKEAYGKLNVTMKTKEGLTHTERFSLLDNFGKINNGALNAFGYFARVALNDFTRMDVDHEELIGHYMTCEVKHNVLPNRNKPGQTVTFIQLGDKKPASGFEPDVTPRPAPAPAPAADTNDLLAKYLG